MMTGMLDYLFDYKVWLIIGFLLIIVDVFVGTFYLLPIGIAGFLMALMLYLDYQHDVVVVELHSWREILIAFAAISLVSVLILRRIFGKTKDSTPDINEY